MEELIGLKNKKQTNLAVGWGKNSKYGSLLCGTKNLDNYSLVEVELITGRAPSNWIRFFKIGYPVLEFKILKRSNKDN